MVDPSKVLEALGYDAAWIAAGVIGEEDLLNQYDTWQFSKDKNPEHYRAMAFRNFLNTTTYLPDAQVDAILQLEDHGPDAVDLGDDRAIALIISGILTDQQLEALPSRHAKTGTPPIEKRYIREQLQRKIQSSGLAATETLLIREADGQLQQALLNRPDLTHNLLTWVGTDGANKKIRNQANQLLKSRRFRDLG